MHCTWQGATQKHIWVRFINAAVVHTVGSLGVFTNKIVAFGCFQLVDGAVPRPRALLRSPSPIDSCLSSARIPPSTPSLTTRHKMPIAQSSASAGSTAECSADPVNLFSKQPHSVDHQAPVNLGHRTRGQLQYAGIRACQVATSQAELPGNECDLLSSTGQGISTQIVDTFHDTF